MTRSEALRETFSHLRALTELTRLFDGKVVDVSSDSVVIEMCAKPSRITSFMKLCKPFGILEASRTGMMRNLAWIFLCISKGLAILGVMAMPRSPVHDHYEPQTEHSYEETEAVDATLLPPG